LLGVPRTRVDAIGPAAPSVDPVRTTSPERLDQPTVDPMADLVGLAERRLRESLESLHSVSEGRTLSEEVFNAMLNQPRE
jgi:hypothetical protein